ncbi:AAA family ATPase [Comamonas sp. SY3]|uniref:AAA family ATPase n=1 Tax=Comamonas sp. SY3 TaxID=3243601 RepID=UPI0035931377
MLEISVAGYKSIGSSTSVRVRGLTILSGKNSSGKSSFMQPILLIKQTLESNFDTGSILLNGPNVKLTDSSQAFSSSSGASSKVFTLKIQSISNTTVNNTGINLEFTKDKNLGLICSRVEARNPITNTPISINKDSTDSDIRNQLPKFSSEVIKNSFENLEIESWSVRQNKCLLDLNITIKSPSISIPLNITDLVEKTASQIIHVPGIRGNPERSYRISTSANRFTGSFDPYVASIIHTWKNSSNNEAKTKATELIADMKSLGLGSEIRANKVNDTQIEIEISRFIGSKSNDVVNIADVGFGVTQTLPVLTSLIAADANQIVYIEQPELHLHPKAQFQLASILAKAVSRGVKVIIETHSAILIRGIQLSVAKKRLNHNSIDLYWFTQDTAGNSKTVASEMDALGRTGDWPSDFDEVSLEVNRSYLNAVESAQE